MASKVLSFDELSAERVEYAEVKVTDTLVVRIGSITPLDLEEWNALRETPEGRQISGAVLIAKSTVDEEGKRTGVTTPYKDMSDEERGKIARLRKMNLKTSEAVLLGIFTLNGIGPKAAEAKNV